MYCIIISNILLKICSESSLNLCEHLARSHGHIAKRALSYLFFAYSLYSNMVVKMVPQQRAGHLLVYLNAQTFSEIRNFFKI